MWRFFVLWCVLSSRNYSNAVKDTACALQACLLDCWVEGRRTTALRLTIGRVPTTGPGKGGQQAADAVG